MANHRMREYETFLYVTMFCFVKNQIAGIRPVELQGT